MAKLSNLLVMIELLKTGRKYSINELSTQLEVSHRTIREYKLFLEEAGIFVDTIRGPYGGYVLRQEVNLPEIMFSNQDVDTLQSAIKLTQDEEVRENLNSLLNKVNIRRIQVDNKNIRLIINDKELSVYNAISKALKYNLKLRIKYYNLQHGESIRTICPLGLYLFQNEWWCSSYWEEKDDMRQFHLKRIIEAEILEEIFDPQKINVKF